MKATVKRLGELGSGVVLAPERHVVSSSAFGAGGVALGELVVERPERARPDELDGALVFDTTHAKDGLLDVRSALRDGGGARSAKKVARAGDLLVSRLRPYLRQIALVHPSAIALAEERPVCVSTEFYVLTAKDPGDSLAYLLPFLLGSGAQAALASAQEGGHHPRVPRDSLFAMCVPRAALGDRAARSLAVLSALEAHYRAATAVAAVLG